MFFRDKVGEREFERVPGSSVWRLCMKGKRLFVLAVQGTCFGYWQLCEAHVQVSVFSATASRDDGSHLW